MKLSGGFSLAYSWSSAAVQDGKYQISLNVHTASLILQSLSKSLLVRRGISITKFQSSFDFNPIFNVVCLGLCWVFVAAHWLP